MGGGGGYRVDRVSISGGGSVKEGVEVHISFGSRPCALGLAVRTFTKSSCRFGRHNRNKIDEKGVGGFCKVARRILLFCYGCAW